jgi:hypothetical protein
MASGFFFVLNVSPGGYAMLLTAADTSKVDRRIKVVISATEHESWVVAAALDWR